MCVYVDAGVYVGVGVYMDVGMSVDMDMNMGMGVGVYLHTCLILINYLPLQNIKRLNQTWSC